MERPSRICEFSLRLQQPLLAPLGSEVQLNSDQSCLNTYLRTANPPVFCSRTCQPSSIREHRHPLQEPSKPEHRIANRPDSNKKPDERLGQRFLQELSLSNARDLVKMIKWNDKYGIKFLQLSSDMFPFASHAEHGYKLAPFASDILAEAGKIIAELGHRVTMHLDQVCVLSFSKASCFITSLYA